MKTLQQVVPLALLSLTPTGCISVNEGHRTGAQPPGSTPPNHDLIHRHLAPDSVTLAAVNAASQRVIESSRLQALSHIARRTPISDHAQVHLAQAALFNLAIESHKTQLLTLLIQNPSFCNPAKEEILVNLGHLSFSSNQSHILELLNKRGELVD